MKKEITPAPVFPAQQTAAVVPKLGGPVEIRTDYPTPSPGANEVLAKVLYTGVCQSDLHTKCGTAAGADGSPITKVKLPHVGGHEGVGRVVELGSGCGDDVKLGALVGIRFASRICRRCDACLAGREQYCPKATNHLHHEDGSFQEYIVLDADYLAILPDDIDPSVIGPVLCAGLTAYKAVKEANVKPMDWVVVSGAGGGLGHLAVQYAKAHGASVVAIDSGKEKGEYLKTLGINAYVDISITPSPTDMVQTLTQGGAHVVIVTSANGRAFAQAADMLRIGGILGCVGIPPGKQYIETPVSSIVIRGLRIQGNLVGSLKECLEAVEYVRRGLVKPRIEVRAFDELPQVYDDLEQGRIAGRVVLKVAKDE
ncbi:MAG: hypothetical protein M1828_004132 [Chrysothrix sp. TS-e1954]|nr:MAG: hypothetical protein M1828_004132 [Chrysothrix sp. TS-e1954]